MKWITRERVKVDRVAYPWLIRKFIDPKAEFLFVPADEVLTVAKREGAIPYDVPNVEFGHHGKPKRLVFMRQDDPRAAIASARHSTQRLYSRTIRLATLTAWQAKSTLFRRLLLLRTVASL